MNPNDTYQHHTLIIQTNKENERLISLTQNGKAQEL